MQPFWSTSMAAAIMWGRASWENLSTRLQLLVLVTSSLSQPTIDWGLLDFCLPVSYPPPLTRA